MIVAPACASDQDFVTAASEAGFFHERGIRGLTVLGEIVCDHLRNGVSTEEVAVPLSEQAYMSLDRAYQFIGLAVKHLCPDVALR